jgi:hypothetical protein
MIFYHVKIAMFVFLLPFFVFSRVKKISKAGHLVKIRTHIQVDARANKESNYARFDIFAYVLTKPPFPIMRKPFSIVSTFLFPPPLLLHSNIDNSP